MYAEFVQLRGFLAGIALVTLVACGDVTVSAPDTTLDGAMTTVAPDAGDDQAASDDAAGTVAMVEGLLEFAGGRPGDDLTLVCVHASAAAALRRAA